MSRHTGSVAIIVLLVMSLLATGCGDDGGSDAEPAGTTTSVTDATADDGPTPTDGAVTTDDTTTTAPPPTTTEPEPVGPEPLDPDTIPALVQAWGEGTTDPLALAEDLIAFPLPIPTPGGTTPLGISIDVFADDPATAWTWDWTYEVLSSEPMPDITVGDEPSPGVDALSDFYDPILADLGFERTATTASDPGNGTQSVNHVYESDGESVTVNGLVAAPKPLFVWADEEQVFGEGVPGYQVDVPFEFEPGVIPVPLLQTIVDEFPEIDGLEFADAALLSWSRDESSFDAEWGLRYFTVSLTWAIPAGTVDDAKETISAHDGTEIVAGVASFFDPGFFELEEPREFGDEWTQSVVFLNRYPGVITIIGDDSVGASVELDLDFEPNRPELQVADE